MDSVSHPPTVVMGGLQTALMAVMNWTAVSVLNYGYCIIIALLSKLLEMWTACHITWFLQHVPAISGGAVMDSVSHLYTVVMGGPQTVLMAVMNWTAVSMIKAWEHLHVSREWCLVDVGGRCPTTNSCVINHRASFLLVKLSTVDFVNVWCSGCCWSTRWWNLVRYLNVDPPPYVHLASTVRHSHHGCSQAFQSTRRPRNLLHLRDYVTSSNLVWISSTHGELSSTASPS